MLNCALWNGRSLNGKVGPLSMKLIEENIDVVLLTETWLKCQNDPVISDLHAAVSGYNIHHHPRTNRQVGGVAILAKSNIKLSEIKQHSFKSFECVEATLGCQSAILRTLVIYRPPESAKNKSTKNDFLNEFSTLLEHVTTLPGVLLIGGDFNFDLSNKHSRDSLNFLDSLYSKNLTQHVSESTHVTGHVLDLIITRADEPVITNINIDGSLNSDHNVVNFRINVKRPPNTKLKHTYRAYTKMNHDSLKERLREEFSTFTHDADSNSIYHLYETKMHAIIDELAPKITKTVTIKPRAQWYSEHVDELNALKAKVRKFERLWRRTKLTIHRDIFTAKPIEYCRRADDLKKNYHRSRI